MSTLQFGLTLTESKSGTKAQFLKQLTMKLKPIFILVIALAFCSCINNEEPEVKSELIDSLAKEDSVIIRKEMHPTDEHVILMNKAVTLLAKPKASHADTQQAIAIYER